MNSLLVKNAVGRERAGLDFSDVARLWPERLGHLQRIAGVVAGVAGPVGRCRVEIVDRLRGKAFGVYRDGLVELNSYEPSMAAGTLVHELGHRASDGVEGLMTERAFIRWVQSSAGLEEWRNAVAQSSGYRACAGDAYMGDWREVWARSYFQWVAERSGDGVLLSQLETLRADHWEEEDFFAVGAAMDKWRLRNDLER